jgi:hypothetical protein
VFVHRDDAKLHLLRGRSPGERHRREGMRLLKKKLITPPPHTCC